MHAPPLLPTSAAPASITPYNDQPSMEFEGNFLANDRTHDIYGEGDKEVAPTLDVLMAYRKPVNLSGQIVIPDPQNRIYGGLAMVYTGFWHNTKVYQIQDIIFCLLTKPPRSLLKSRISGRTRERTPIWRRPTLE